MLHQGLFLWLREHIVVFTFKKKLLSLHSKNLLLIKKGVLIIHTFLLFINVLRVIHVVLSLSIKKIRDELN